MRNRLGTSSSRSPGEQKFAPLVGHNWRNGVSTESSAAAGAGAGWVLDGSAVRYNETPLNGEEVVCNAAARIPR